METSIETEPSRSRCQAPRWVLPATLLLALSLTSLSQAQSPFEMSLAHRTLQYTHIETAGPLSVNEGEAVPMSRPIVFDCPGAKGTTCTLLIRVDSQYVGLTPGWNFDIWWVLDGQNRPGFGPTPGLAMASEVDRSGPPTRWALPWSNARCRRAGTSSKAITIWSKIPAPPSPGRSRRRCGRSPCKC
jgi:hypothetical protein